MSCHTYLKTHMCAAPCLAAGDLFSVRSPLTRSVEPCCDHTHVLSYMDVEVDPEVLLNEDDISINNVTLHFSNLIPPHARTYKTEAGDEAVISYNELTGSITGTLHTADGHAFALEQCGRSYIFEEFDVASFPAEEEEDDSDYAETAASPGANTTAASRQGQRTYSVMFYYTAEFAAATPNIEDFFDQVERVNQSFQPHFYINKQLTRLLRRQTRGTPTATCRSP